MLIERSLQLAGFLSGFVLATSLAAAVIIFYRKRSSVRLGLQQLEQGQQLEELGKLTGGLAHEIKNPLSTVKVSLKLITEDIASDYPEATRLLRKINVVCRETERVEHILDDFLRYVGRAELHVVRVDANTLVGEMVDFFMPQARGCGITMHVGLSDKPVICEVDATMFKQVLLNLFINAQQAMSGGGELIVRTLAENDVVKIEVADTGCGISKDRLENIFQAYYTSKSGGSGLGLPTVRKIIDAHKGLISVDSEPGRGTSFVITLPRTEQDIR